MRNLKKILALVLALVMSLSLMATASAGSFPDVADGNAYGTAIEVLDGLKVFKGYAEDGTFRPENPISRAEVATIIYRIATGDVEDAQNAIYTTWNKFTDVNDTDWYAGYINYCANAEYVMGNGDGTFAPRSEVTGYAVLAMILRAMGWDKNGEFEGSDWQVQTAAIARQEGLLKGVTNANEEKLGQSAPRGLVAQILFNALLAEMVDYTVLNGYVHNGRTLGYESLGLEEVEGVVVANEYADLYGDEVLAEGKTQIQVKDETSARTLNYGTKLTDIGESRLIYTAYESNVLYLADSGKNTVTQFGNACDISTPSKFSSVAEMPAASDIEYFINFGRVGTYDCDQRLEFSVTFASAVAESSFNGYDGVTISVVAAADNSDSIADNDWTVETVNLTTGATITNLTNALGSLTNYANVPGYTYAANQGIRYTKIIRAGHDITENDLAVIYGIFGAADNIQNNLLAKDSIEGDVFVGTYSTQVNQEDRDLSNKISYKTFFADYINEVTYNDNWENSGNGDWVKFVDNDGDGKADYAFKTVARLDEVVSMYANKDGQTVAAYYSFDDEGPTKDWDTKYTVRYMDGVDPIERDVNVGDVVVATLIDNQMLVGHAADVTKTVTDYSWKEDVIKTTDGDDYGQSMILNCTEMMQLLSTMADKTEYIMYLDSFGYVRAYKLPGETTYALLTELYYSNNNQGNIVQDWPMTVEMTIAEGATKEYSVTNVSATPLRGLRPWTGISGLATTGMTYNWLQPAIAHLGVTRTGFGPTRFAPTLGAAYNLTFWRSNYQLIPTINNMNGSQEFDYGAQNYSTGAGTTSVDPTVSFTNVAVVTVDGSNASLAGAAQLKLDRDGSVMYRSGNARYAVDYIQLSTADIAGGATRYSISNADASDDASPFGYEALNNYYVNAVNDTEYYIVYNRTGGVGVAYFKGFANFPGVTNKDNNIHAAYAVARDTSSDEADNPYWVADVIVYEVENWDDNEKSSISLAYYNPSRNTDQVQLLNTLNNKSNDPMIDVIPPAAWNADAWRGGWGTSYVGYGFYDLYNTALNDNGQLTARSISAITKEFAKSGIYAGTLTREVYIGTGGLYIDVNLTGSKEANGSLKTEASIMLDNNIYSITTDQIVGSTWDYNEATPLQYSSANSSQVKAGDRVIWVGGAGGVGRNSAAFIVDLGNVTNNVGIWNRTATFLLGNGNVDINDNPVLGLWRTIYNEQEDLYDDEPTEAWEVTYKVVGLPTDSAAKIEKLKTYISTTGVGSTVINFSEPAFQVDGYMLTTIANSALTEGTVATITTPSWSAVTGTYTTDGEISLSNVSEDVVVTLTYAHATHEVKMVSGWNSVTTPSVTQVDADTTDISSAPGTSAVVAAYTNDVDLDITLSGAFAATGNQKVEVTVKKASDGTTVKTGFATGSGTAYSYAFEMPDYSVDVDVQVIGDAYAITVTGDNIISNPDSPIGTDFSSAETVIITAAQGYWITGFTVTDSTGADVTPDAGSTNPAALPMKFIRVIVPSGTNDDVTIDVDTEIMNITARVYNNAAGGVAYSLGSWSGDVGNFGGTSVGSGVTATVYGVGDNVTINSPVNDKVVYVYTTKGAAVGVTGGTATQVDSSTNNDNAVWACTPDGTAAVMLITVA